MRLRLMNHAVINVTRCHDVYLMNPHIICTSLQSRDAIMQFLNRSHYFCKFRCDISVESRKEKKMSLKSADLSWTLVPKKIVFVNR